ncbi:hypothetical protein AYO38_10450 [bacterium SCGC AG-212-C10]|nr:hypothetical protein AYO38_10450 [bacterium SCGC AG-212-C10]
MAITLNDAWDFVRYVAEHPELQAELRPLILGPELLSLPELVRENSRQIADLREQTAANTAAIVELRESVSELRVQTAANTAAIAELREQTAANTAAIAGLTTAVEELILLGKQHTTMIGTLNGDVLGLKYERHMRSYLSHVLNDVETIYGDYFKDMRQALREQRLNARNWRAVMDSDLILRGTPDLETEPVIVTVEASVAIDRHDIERSKERADILKAWGYRAVGLVAGKRIDDRDTDRARESGVAVMIGGQLRTWPLEHEEWILD